MSSGDTAWILVSAALVLFVTVGLAFVSSNDVAEPSQ
jgi:ammonia channel protein AmtB